LNYRSQVTLVWTTFEDFFFLLRDSGIPVTITEWLTLQDALAQGLEGQSLSIFYTMARSILVKDIKFYDQYDVAFAFYFKDKDLPEKLRKQLLDWLARPARINRGLLDILELDRNMDLQKLLDEFNKRLEEQTERHDLGSYWVGTGGDSPFGNSGQNPFGIRVGGSGGGHMAVMVAEDRKFQNYRHDLVLDTRQIKVALKKLRKFKRVGIEEELDIDDTIDKTAKNAGDIELVFKPPRKNLVKVVLFMDAGGSMEPFANLVNLLFSAAHQSNHFKDFKYFYFHNCIYDYVYKNIEMEQRITTAQVLRDLDKDYRAIIVGDAAMAPYELESPSATISLSQYQSGRGSTTGLDWLKQVRKHFEKAVWLNPLNERYWGSYTTGEIRQVFKMLPLTLQGLEEAVKELTG
jgi:hypothetical protein